MESINEVGAIEPSVFEEFNDVFVNPSIERPQDEAALRDEIAALPFSLRPIPIPEGGYELQI